MTLCRFSRPCLQQPVDHSIMATQHGQLVWLQYRGLSAFFASGGIVGAMGLHMANQALAAVSYLSYLMNTNSTEQKMVIEGIHNPQIHSSRMVLFSCIMGFNIWAYVDSDNPLL